MASSRLTGVGNISVQIFPARIFRPGAWTGGLSCDALSTEIRAYYGTVSATGVARRKEISTMFCPSCGASNREGARFCRACGKALYAPQASHFVEVRHEDAGRLRQLDLCFVMDATGSMGSYIEATRKELEHFARTLSSHDIHPDACYGLVLYRDHIGSARDVVTQRYP